jgi:nucleotide-binding universal stress UspA family protein
VITLRRILCPIDLSEVSRHALDYAVALARWYESTITILHVDEGRDARVHVGKTDTAPAPTTPADELAAFCAPWIRAVERVEVICSSGPVVSEIAALRDKLPADLLRRGRAARSGATRRLPPWPSVLWWSIRRSSQQKSRRQRSGSSAPMTLRQSPVRKPAKTSSLARQSPSRC